MLLCLQINVKESLKMYSGVLDFVLQHNAHFKVQCLGYICVSLGAVSVKVLFKTLNGFLHIHLAHQERLYIFTQLMSMSGLPRSLDFKHRNPLPLSVK